MNNHIIYITVYHTNNMVILVFFIFMTYISRNYFNIFNLKLKLKISQMWE